MNAPISTQEAQVTLAVGGREFIRLMARVSGPRLESHVLWLISAAPNMNVNTQNASFSTRLLLD